MTTHRLKRCGHCLVRYSYQSSGHGCMRPLNDDRYCPTCKGVIKRALSDVPPKIKHSWEPTDEVTLEQLQEWESLNEQDRDKRDDELEAQGKFVLRGLRRVLPGLYDFTDPHNHHICRHVYGRGDFHSRAYTYKYWTKRPAQVNIEMETETDLETGQTQPWKVFR